MAVMIGDISLYLPLTEDVLDHAGEAEEGHRQDRGGDQRDGHALEGRGRVVVLDPGADAGEEDHRHHEAEAGAEGVEQRLGVAGPEAGGVKNII